MTVSVARLSNKEADFSNITLSLKLLCSGRPSTQGPRDTFFFCFLLYKQDTLVACELASWKSVVPLHCTENGGSPPESSRRREVSDLWHFLICRFLRFQMGINE